MAADKPCPQLQPSLILGIFTKNPNLLHKIMYATCQKQYFLLFICWLDEKNILLKWANLSELIYSEKATKVCEISTLILSYVHM